MKKHKPSMNDAQKTAISQPRLGMGHAGNHVLANSQFDDAKRGKTPTFKNGLEIGKAAAQNNQVSVVDQLDLRNRDRGGTSTGKVG